MIYKNKNQKINGETRDLFWAICESIKSVDVSSKSAWITIGCFLSKELAKEGLESNSISKFDIELDFNPAKTLKTQDFGSQIEKLLDVKYELTDDDKIVLKKLSDEDKKIFKLKKVKEKIKQEPLKQLFGLEKIS